MGALWREFGLMGNNERRSHNLGNHKGCPYRCLRTDGLTLQRPCQAVGRN